MHKKALEIRLNHFGENHVDTATSLNNIALIYEKIGECESAIEMQMQSYKIIQNIFGEEHPYTGN